MTADLSCLKNVRLIIETMDHLGYPADRLQLVLNRSNAFTGINVKNAEGALKRTIEHQVVNEYRGATAGRSTRRRRDPGHHNRLGARAPRCSSSRGRSNASAGSGRRSGSSPSSPAPAR